MPLRRPPHHRASALVALLACLALLGAASAQDVRFGASGSAAGIVAVDATWLFLDVPSERGDLRFGVRADLSARLTALGAPSAAASVILDAAPEAGVAAHLGAGVALMRASAPARDLVPSALLLAGAEWPVAEFLRVRLEGSVVPAANAAGVGLGLVVLPFGGSR